MVVKTLVRLHVRVVAPEPQAVDAPTVPEDAQKLVREALQVVVVRVAVTLVREALQVVVVRAVVALAREVAQQPAQVIAVKVAPTDVKKVAQQPAEVIVREIVKEPPQHRFVKLVRQRAFKIAYRVVVIAVMLRVLEIVTVIV